MSSGHCVADSISGARGGGGGPVSGAAGGCLLEAASAAGNLFITPHNTRALGGAASAGQGPVNDTAHARRGPSRRAAGTDGGSLSCASGRSHPWFTRHLCTQTAQTAPLRPWEAPALGRRTWASMTARRAAQQAAFCFFVRPRRRVAGVKRAAGRAADGCWLGGGGGGRGGCMRWRWPRRRGRLTSLPGRLLHSARVCVLKARTFYLYFAPQLHLVWLADNQCSAGRRAASLPRLPASLAPPAALRALNRPFKPGFARAAGPAAGFTAGCICVRGRPGRLQTGATVLACVASERAGYVGLCWVLLALSHSSAAV